MLALKILYAVRMSPSLNLFRQLKPLAAMGYGLAFNHLIADQIKSIQPRPADNSDNTDNNDNMDNIDNMPKTDNTDNATTRPSAA